MDVQKALAAIAADAARGDMVFSTNAEIDLRVQRALDDPDCSLDELAKLISAEPILSARVVAIANSVAYNRSGRASSDVHHAVSRLGFKTLRMLVTALIVRQMENMSQVPEHRALAVRLWEHTAHVAALARVIAQRVTHQDPDAAFFAGIVHEVGGFYLISRASAFPGLFAGDLTEWHDQGEADVGRAVLRVLGVPDNVLAAVETLWGGYLALPPESLGDTLLLADELSPVESPLSQMSGMGCQGMAVDIDMSIDDETLSGILRDSAEEVASLTAALRA
ncbi:MAG: HDOD domain-containing protein [Rhodocyclaceae bacterium]